MIKLRFISEAKPHDRVIQWYSRSKWNHVDICTPDGCFLGARVVGGVQVRPANYVTPRETLYLAMADLTPAEEVAFWNLAWAQIGRPYNWRGITGFFLNTDWDDGSTFFCSQLPIWIRHMMGKPLLRLTYSDQASPAILTMSLKLTECLS